MPWRMTEKEAIARGFIPDPKTKIEPKVVVEIPVEVKAQPPELLPLEQRFSFTPILKFLLLMIILSVVLEIGVGLWLWYLTASQRVC